VKEKIVYAVIILAAMGLLVWLALATRYQYYANASADDPHGSEWIAFRDDGWTRTREVLRCEERPTGPSIFSGPSLTSAPQASNQGHVSLPLSASDLDRLNRERQNRHLPKVDKWGHELARTCRWTPLQEP
jgi:hypothetical protein